MSKSENNSSAKPFYKKVGFWVAAIIALFVLIYIVGPKKSPDDNPQYPELHGSSSEANPDFHGANITLSEVNNDVTGKWRVAVISEPITISDYVVEYYNQFLDGKDEIHAIINKSQNTTTKIMHGAMGITVSVYEYVNGEEQDAKKMFSGKLLSEKYYDSKTGEEIITD